MTVTGVAAAAAALEAAMGEGDDDDGEKGRGRDTAVSTRVTWKTGSAPNIPKRAKHNAAVLP